MSEATYQVLAAYRKPPSSVPYLELSFTELSQAWSAYREMMKPTSAEMYSRIELVMWDEEDCGCKAISTTDFELPDSF